MSTYTTGELAQKVGVSIRTIQYYDKKQLVCPAELSENNRRVYTDEQLKRLEVILFLKSLGFKLSTIKQLLESEDFKLFLPTLLDQQEEHLKKQITADQQALNDIEKLRKGLLPNYPVTPENLIDIEHAMKKSKKLIRNQIGMITIGLGVDALEFFALWYGITTKNWTIVGLIILVIVLIVSLMVHRMYHLVMYVCPTCQTHFQPSLSAFFWSAHTSKTRRLTCPHCEYHGFCIEIPA